MSHSADQEVMMLATRSTGVADSGGAMIVLTSEWEPLAEMPQPVPMRASSSLSMAWRTDGQYLAILCDQSEASSHTHGKSKPGVSDVGAILEKAGAAAPLAPKRGAGDQAGPCIRIYTQDLRPHGIGRHENGSAVEGVLAGGPLRSSPSGSGVERARGARQGPLCWSPSGALIAASQADLRRKQLSVILFERNGLRHGEFVIPCADPALAAITHLQWGRGAGGGSGGEALCVVLGPAEGASVTSAQDGAGSGRGVIPQWSVLQVWVRGNYHWYAKFERRYGDLDAAERAVKVIGGVGGGNKEDAAARARGSAAGGGQYRDGGVLPVTSLRPEHLRPEAQAAAAGSGAGSP